MLPPRPRCTGLRPAQAASVPPPPGCPLLTEQLPDMTDYLEILSGLDDEDGPGAAPTGGGRPSPTHPSGWVAEYRPANPEEGKPFAGRSARRRGFPLTRTAGERQEVQPPQGPRTWRRRLSGSGTRRPRRPAGPAGSPGIPGGHHTAEIARLSPKGPGRPERWCSKASCTSSAERPPGWLLGPQNQPRVDGARAGGHHQALHRRESHGGVDRAAEGHCGERCTGAEMSGHQPELLPWTPDKFAGTPAGPRVVEPVEPVTSNPQFSRQELGTA